MKKKDELAEGHPWTHVMKTIAKNMPPLEEPAWKKAVRLLGKRVEMNCGVRGRVIAIGLDGGIKVENENEHNEYAYWFNMSEFKRLLPIKRAS